MISIPKIRKRYGYGVCFLLNFLMKNMAIVLAASFPIVTSGLRTSMPLSTGSLAEKWNSLAPESLAISAMLFSFIPQPGIMIILPAAAATSLESMSAPSRAVGMHPDVSILTHPDEMMSSNARNGLRVWSKALWKVLFHVKDHQDRGH